MMDLLCQYIAEDPAVPCRGPAGGERVHPQSRCKAATGNELRQRAVSFSYCAGHEMDEGAVIEDAGREVDC